MLKHLLSACLMLAFFPLTGRADIYTNIKYDGGYPGFTPTEKSGTLHIGQDGVCFKADAQTFLIEYPSIREQSYESQSKNRGLRGVTVVAPGAVALATSLGASLLGNIVAGPRPVSTHFYRIRFVDHNQVTQEVTFRVPSEGIRRKIMDDVQSSSQAELYNVMMQGQGASATGPIASPGQMVNQPVGAPTGIPLDTPSVYPPLNPAPEPSSVTPLILSNPAVNN